MSQTGSARHPEESNKYETASRFLFWFALAFATFIFLLRASRADIIWNDEVYTIGIIQTDFKTIIARTAPDVHPPLYYFLIKVWFELIGFIGIPANQFTGRLLNIAFVLGSIFMARLQLDPWLGRNRSRVLLALVLFLPALNDNTDDLRNYVMIMMLVLNGGIAFSRLMTSFDKADFSLKSKDNLQWLIYLVTMSIAWWTHALVGVILLWFGLAWSWIVIRKWIQQHRITADAFLIKGAIVNSLLILIFTPWLIIMGDQIEFLNRVAPYFMTQPTVWNLFSVLFVTVFSGQDNWSHMQEYEPLYIAFSIATILATLIFLIFTHYKNTEKTKGLLLFSASLIIFMGHVYTHWILSLYEIATIFHAPRYPIILMPWFVLMSGIAITGFQTKRDGVNSVQPINRFALPVLLPWFLIFFTSSVFSTVNQKSDYLVHFLEYHDRLLPEPGEIIYITPDETINFYAPLLTEYQVEPLSNILKIKPEDRPESIHVLFTLVAFEKENLLLWEMAYSESLYRPKVQFRKLGFYHFGLLEITDPEQSDLDAMIPNQMPVPRTQWPDFPDSALTIIHPYDLKENEGWGVMEFDKFRNMFRWGLSEELVLNLKEPLPPGKYSFTLVGMTLERPGFDRTLEMQFGEGESHSQPLPAGGFRIYQEFEVFEGTSLSRIDLHYSAINQESEETGKKSGRELSILYNGSWIESAP